MAFVERRADKLFLDSQSFRIVGGNCYYLGYVDESAITAVLDLADRAGINTLRIWAFAEAASITDGVHFQRWNSEQSIPEVNTGPKGLERLDHAVTLAGSRGAKLILTLANYWSDFGGVNAYRKWFGLSHNDEFYSDDRCRAAYKQYVEQLISRRNTVSGQLYSDDPAILAWELMNEPRAKHSSACVDWIAEMSGFIRPRAPNHLISVGDEGYFSANGGNFEATLKLETIDFGTYHLYAEWLKRGDPAEFGRKWIRAHVAAGQLAQKPVLLEEYGSARDKAALYETWLNEIVESGALGSMVWMIGIPPGANQPYALDRYVISDDPELLIIRNHSELMRECG